MTNLEQLNQERLENSIQKCELHIQRIHYAEASTEKLFPISMERYSALTDEEIALVDQLVYRFSKLQDEIGNNTFRFLLIYLQEDVANKAFKDILNRLEQLRIIDAANDWLELRELRNSLAHEYPTLVSETIGKLNYLRTQIPRIIAIFEAVKSAMGR